MLSGWVGGPWTTCMMVDICWTACMRVCVFPSSWWVLVWSHGLWNRTASGPCPGLVIAVAEGRRPRPLRWRRQTHARALSKDDRATHGDLRDAVTTLEEIEPTVRRVFGGANPTTEAIERSLRNSRAELRARETPDA